MAEHDAAAKDRDSAWFAVDAVKRGKWTWRELEDYIVQDLAETRATARAEGMAAGRAEALAEAAAMAEHWLGEGALDGLTSKLRGMAAAQTSGERQGKG